MARKVAQHRISQCFSPSPRAVSLSERRVALAVLVFMVAGSLLVAHVALRFAIRDVRMQHRQLQEQVRNLLQQKERLEHEKETLCNSQNLRETGRRQLAMMETDPRSQLTVAVASDLRQKYTRGAATRTAVALADRAENAKDRGLLMTLVDASPAFAAVPGRE